MSGKRVKGGWGWAEGREAGAASKERTAKKYLPGGQAWQSDGGVGPQPPRLLACLPASVAGSNTPGGRAAPRRAEPPGFRAAQSNPAVVKTPRSARPRGGRAERGAR